MAGEGKKSKVGPRSLGLPRRPCWDVCSRQQLRQSTAGDQGVVIAESDKGTVGGDKVESFYTKGSTKGLGIFN